MASEPTKPKLISHHPPSRSWTSFWYDDEGNKRTKRLGREGEVSQKEARARYDDWMQTEWRRHDHIRNPGAAAGLFTVSRLRDEFLTYARATYRKNGEETSHVGTIEYALRILVEHHGDSPADSLTNPQLSKLREAMIFKASGEARGLKTVNSRFHAIRQAYKWAREKGFVSAVTLADILAVAPLRRGRSAANDPVEVQPVDWSVVEATLPHCPPTVVTMIRLHGLTGMRPGELCSMRPCDIEAGGKVWLYRPSSHKTQHKGKKRVITLGPQAQELLRPFLKRDLSSFMFVPAEAQQQRREARSLARKTPPGQGNVPGSNRKSNPKCGPGDCYSAGSYRKAIRHACRAVEKTLRKEEPKAEFPAWHPNQIRHTVATRVRKEHGIEEASAILGHSHISTTEIYAKQSLDRSIKLAAAEG